MSQKGTQIQLLNLAKIQMALDEIVFENIDTGFKWAHAQQLLEKLYAESKQYFISYVESIDGKLPKANSYWALFMDITSKLTYFIAFTEQQQNGDHQQLAEKYKAAASFLPNCQHESCVEFYEEIRSSYKQVTGEELPNTNYSIEETIQHYYQAIRG